MDSLNQRAVDILKGLGGCPATPFHEEKVARHIMKVLKPLGMDVRRDEYGNIVARVRGNTAGAPPIAFVAHMDHPGYETIEAGPGLTVARAMGGVPPASYHKPTPVLVIMPDGRRVKATANPHARANGDDRLVRIEPSEPVDIASPAPVVFDLPDFVLDGDTIRMRAMDDLAGCAAITAMLERLAGGGADGDVYGVFTRAEEGGLFGARLMAQDGTLPKETIVVSVESSPAIPGVAQGAGPVIRTGDAASTFVADAEQVLIVARDAIRQRNKEFKCQRQLMSGGTCEATAFAAFGYSVTGIAFPLGNYHNATTKIPDPDGGVGAEYINVSDFLGGVELITEAAGSVSKRGDTQVRRWLREVQEDVRVRLRSTAG